MNGCLKVIFHPQPDQAQYTYSIVQILTGYKEGYKEGIKYGDINTLYVGKLFGAAREMNPRKKNKNINKIF